MRKDSRSKFRDVVDVVGMFVDLGAVAWEVGVLVVRGVAGLLEVG